MLKSILLSSLILNVGLLLGRLSGFVREAFLAASFGTGFQADIAVLMLSLPDLLVNILVGGALAAALIPEFNRCPELGRSMLFQSLLLTSVVFSMLAVLLNVFIEPFMSVFAPGFSEATRNAAYGPMRWVMWLIPLTVAAGVYQAFLHAHNRFAIAVLGALIINLVIVFGLWVIQGQASALVYLGLFVLIGGVVRLGALAVASARHQGWPMVGLSPWLVDKGLVKKFVQVASAGSLLLCFPVVIRAYASFSGEGAVAQVSYALKLVELPLALTVTFLAAILFPRLSKAYEEANGQFYQLVLWGLRITMFLALVAVAAMLPVAFALSDVVYGYGKMASESVLLVSQFVAISMFYIPFMGAATFAAASLNAMHNTRAPLVINTMGLVALLVCLQVIPAGDLESQLLALVASYAIIGVISLLALFKWMPSLFKALFQWQSVLLGVLLVGLVYFGTQYLVQNVENSFGQIVIAALAAVAACVVAALSVAQIRSKIQYVLFGKLKHRD